MSPRRKPPVRETVTLDAARTHLSSLVERAAQGEEFVISKSGRPLALLVPLGDVPARRRPGPARGTWTLKGSADAPAPDELLDGFEA